MGRGGTDLKPLMVYAEGKCNGLCVLSDLEAMPFKRKFDLDILWIISEFGDLNRELPYEGVGLFWWMEGFEIVKESRN